MTQLTIETLPILLQNYQTALETVQKDLSKNDNNDDPLFVLEYRIALNKRLIRLLALLQKNSNDKTTLPQLVSNLNQNLKELSEEDINALIDQLNMLLLSDKDTLFKPYYNHSEKDYQGYTILGQLLVDIGVIAAIVGSATLLSAIVLATALFIGIPLMVYGMVKDYKETNYQLQCKIITTAVDEVVKINNEPFKMKPTPFKFFGLSEDNNKQVAQDINQSYANLVK